MPLIKDREAAARLARTIVADIALYNKDKIRDGIQNDNIFALLEKEIKEGLELYRSKVSPDIDKKNTLFNKAIVDILIKRYGTIKSKIW